MLGPPSPLLNCLHADSLQSALIRIITSFNLFTLEYCSGLANLQYLFVFLFNLARSIFFLLTVKGYCCNHVFSYWLWCLYITSSFHTIHSSLGDMCITKAICNDYSNEQRLFQVSYYT